MVPSRGCQGLGHEPSLRYNHRQAPVQSDPFLGRCNGRPPIPRRSDHLSAKGLLIPTVSHFTFYQVRRQDGTPFATRPAELLANKVGRELGGPWDHSSSQTRANGSTRAEWTGSLAFNDGSASSRWGRLGACIHSYVHFTL